jgi:HAD superfamily hydrolase (TIGR01490 family)
VGTDDAARLAFYDFDGTLVAGNVVTRLGWLVRQRPSRLDAGVRWLMLAAQTPLYAAVNRRSRRRFNELFFRSYRGLERDWLEQVAPRLYERVIRPRLFADARRAIEADRRDGFRLVLVSGELDVALAPLAAELGFDRVICNRLIYREGRAIGEVVPPLVAEDEKPRAMRRLCRELNADLEHCKAYSDSISDLPMLEAVGLPTAVNPDGRLGPVARARGWPVESWN